MQQARRRFGSVGVGKIKFTQLATVPKMPEFPVFAVTQPAKNWTTAMKGTRHGEEQIIAILKQGEAGLTTAKLCRQHGITEQNH